MEVCDLENTNQCYSFFIPRLKLLITNKRGKIWGERKEAEKSLLKESPPPRSRTAHKNGSYSASAPEKKDIIICEEN